MIFVPQNNYENAQALLKLMELVRAGFTPDRLKESFGVTAAGGNTFETITGIAAATIQPNEIFAFWFNGVSGGIAGYINNGGGLNIRPVTFNDPLFIDQSQWNSGTFLFNNAAAGTYSCFSFELDKLGL